MSRTIRSMMRRMARFIRNISSWHKEETKVIFGGRLGEYKYYDMDAVIDSALKCAEKRLEE